MIADPPDATRAHVPTCAWCEQPLGRDMLRPLSQLRCQHCGARTTLPWPLAADAAPRPAAASGGSATRSHRAGVHRLCALSEAARRRARRRLASRVARVAPPGPVLDVGSGDGLLLDALRATGRLVTGISARTAAGAPSAVEGFRDAEITELGGRYAAIVFWQSLGRLPAPGAALDHAAALLKPGGLLAVAQPSPARVQARALGERIGAPAVPRERVRIPPQTVVERLRELGLQIDRVDHLIERGTPAGWVHNALGGMIAIEARR